MSKMSKKKTILLGTLGLIFVLSIGVVLAYLQVNTESKANLFTFGNVKIELYEDEWDELSDEDKLLYPGKDVNKDPTVKNIGKNDAYIFLEIRVPRASVCIIDDNENILPAVWTELFTYAVNVGWEQIGNDELSDYGDYVTRVYAYTAMIVAPNTYTTPLFDKVTFVNILEGEISKGTTLIMPINALAIQAEYLNETGDTILEKMTDAYMKYQAEPKE